MIERYVYKRDEAGFEEAIRTEASQLAKCQFGPELLCTLADMYMCRAELYLADELEGRFTWQKTSALWKQSSLENGQKWELVKGVMGVANKVRQIRSAVNASGVLDDAAGAAAAADGDPANPASASARPSSPAASSTDARSAEASAAAPEPKPDNLDDWLKEDTAPTPATAPGAAARADAAAAPAGAAAPAAPAAPATTAEAEGASASDPTQDCASHKAPESSSRKSTSLSEEERKEAQRKVAEDAVDDALPAILKTVWAAVVMDISSTFKEVSRKLFKDKSVPWQIRVRRAQAVLRLGQIFREEGLKASSQAGVSTMTFKNAEAAKAMLQEAMIGAVTEKK